ncbi:PEP-CTERM system TPR-repeat protein PrsT [Aestuariibacter sp. AA17]|uniref:PEP-CTERM system TPR-repeat protein PrsT n=1 Tax=Fluctibacter corallii TaxID=2984329 RepID=A0ABT3A6Y0_9ALTE|nr:XrtA/PEP-CTERM system TPR-repeat protein PrsT [Aestuariibacter sp. AA17]MCV2884436.1 PEP-CTERM system TPR-repeat protein PrsT [Aestuariibacter sp. AA17]
MKKSLIALSLGFLISCGQQTSDEHLTSAKAFLEQDNVPAAIVELKNAVQLDPKSAEARFLLGEAYMQRKEYANAEKELSRAMDLGYPVNEVVPLLSQAYKQTNAHAALSEMDIKNTGLSDVEKLKVGFAKLQSLLALDKQGEAAALVEELSALDTRSVYKGLVEVVGLILNEGYDEALTSLASLREQAPMNADIMQLQGRLYLQLNRIEDAIAVYRDFVKNDSADTESKFILARLLVNNQNTKEAAGYIDELLKLSKENPLLNQLKATTSAAEGEFEVAQEYAEKAIYQGNTDPTLRLVAGYAAYQRQDFEGTNRHLAFIASDLPPAHPALKMLAASQLQLGLTSQASTILNKIENVSESDASLFSRTGYELIRSGNVEEAKALVQKSETISQSAEDLTRLGVLKLSLNNVEGILDLEKAVDKSPALESAKTTLGTAYLATQQFDKALALAENWISSEPNSVDPYILKTEVYIQQKAFTDARNAVTKALEIEPGNGIVQLAEARIDVAQGQNEQALNKINQILAQKADFIPAIAAYYQVKKASEQSDGAMTPALNALNTSPENKALKELVARMHFSEANYDASMALLEDTTFDNQTASNLWSLYGQLLLRLNQTDKALSHYDKWLALQPLNKDAILGKLLILDARQNYTQGVELASGFLENRNDSQIAMLNTHFTVMSGQFVQAREMFNALPDNIQALPIMKSTLARILVAEQQPQDALPLAKAAYEAVSNTRNVVLNLAILELLDRQQDGIQLLEKHIASNPTDIAALMLLAERQINSDPKKAAATYEKTLALRSDNFVVLNNIAYLYSQEGDNDKAEEFALRAVELQPENAAALDTLAQIYVAESRFDDALKYYERAINDDMQNEEIYLNYIEALLAADKTALAKRKLAQRELQQEASKQRIEALKRQYQL